MELKSWDALQGKIKERACMTCQILCSFLYCAYDLLCVFLERQTESWLTNLNVKKSHLKLKCVFLDVIQVVSFFLCFFFLPFYVWCTIQDLNTKGSYTIWFLLMCSMTYMLILDYNTGGILTVANICYVTNKAMKVNFPPT